MPPQDPETARWFSEEVLPHEAMLRGYLRGMLPGSDIDDVVQETYIRLLRARARAYQVKSARGLLFATARNAACDLFRRRTTVATVPVEENVALAVLDEGLDVPEVASRRQEGLLLHEAIQALPDRCREVMILRKFHRLSQKEVAAKLGIAEHTVELHLMKGLRRCQDYFMKKGVSRR